MELYDVIMDPMILSNEPTIGELRIGWSRTQFRYSAKAFWENVLYSISPTDKQMGRGVNTLREIESIREEPENVIPGECFVTQEYVTEPITSIKRR